MQSAFSVELGREDPALEVPWSSDDGLLRFYDLKQQPELLLEISETRHNQELGEFLAAINSAYSPLASAKCDTWLTNELDAEDEVFQASWKFGCYVDVFYSRREDQASFPAHEALGQSLERLLRKVPEISGAVEIILRRCYFQRDGMVAEGFALTLYVFGYGDDEEEARRRWAVAMKLAQNALMQAAVAQARSAP